ncbi:MAG: 3D domain-containing protein [Anaerohalosphaeraceae bacterium]
MAKWEKSSCYSRPTHGGYEAALLSSLLMAVLLGGLLWHFEFRGRRVVSLYSAWAPVQPDGSVQGFAGEQQLPAVQPEAELLGLLREFEQIPADNLKVEPFAPVWRPKEAKQPKEKWRVVRMRVTGYCPCAKCCGRYADGITASNHRIRPGDVFVAADKRYSFGTEMIIPGYNGNRPVQVKDRGRLIKGNRLDVFFASHEQAQKWGSKTLNVLVKEE